MSEQQTSPQFRQLNPAELVFSKSTAQAERRKHFDGEQLKELIASVSEKGIVQPIVVRPIDKGFEVVAGERRVLAARKAGLPLIPAMVHQLDEDQALDVQLIENLQREGLHPLVEAEGYEALKKNKHTVEQIADKVGKSKEYVYGRMKLLALGEKVRAAFYERQIDASKALIFARLSDGDQKKALAGLLDSNRYEPMSFRRFVDYVQREFMLRLDQAGFKTEDPDLVPTAGPCGKCPKNTASQPGLFADVSKAALCTDSKCFQAKIAATAAIRVQEAKSANQPVLEGKEAKKAIETYSGDYAKPDRMVDGDSQYRTYQKLLGRDLKKVTTVAVDPSSGAAVELVDKAAAKKLIKEKGIKLSSSSSNGARKRTPQEIEKAKKAEKEEKLDLAVRREVATQLMEKAPKPLHRDELELIYNYIQCHEPIVEEVLGDLAKVNLKKATEPQLLKLVRAHLFGEILDNTYDKPDVLFAAAKRAGVNVDKVRKDLAAAEKESGTPKKAAKK